MRTDPLAAVGVMVLHDAEGREIPGGTCFRFRQDHIALTAAHCVPQNIDDCRLFFMRTHPNELFEVQRVERHPDADLAALFMAESQDDDDQGYPTHAFWHEVNNLNLGEPFIAYGYPIEGPLTDSATPAPVPRVFTGHYQRFFRFNSPAGYAYPAGEMSIPAPVGMSGGPVFRPGAPTMVTGMVTANLESYSIIDSIEDINDDGKRLRVESRRVIEYGVALRLGGVSDWLDTHIPNRKGTAHGD